MSYCLHKYGSPIYIRYILIENKAKQHINSLTHEEAMFLITHIDKKIENRRDVRKWLRCLNIVAIYKNLN